MNAAVTIVFTGLFALLNRDEIPNGNGKGKSILLIDAPNASYCQAKLPKHTAVIAIPADAIKDITSDQAFDPPVTYEDPKGVAWVLFNLEGKVMEVDAGGTVDETTAYKNDREYLPSVSDVDGTYV